MAPLLGVAQHRENTGYWVDDGWYDYFRDNYSASMTATTRIEPDEKVPTASGDLMKSGYGVTNTVTATVSTSAPLSHYTYGQTAVSYFPEFGYGTYWRLLERLTSGTAARFQFAKTFTAPITSGCIFRRFGSRMGATRLILM